MKRDLGKLAAAAALSAAMIATGPAAAQKQGGILRGGHFDSPASMSMLEESTLAYASCTNVLAKCWLSPRMLQHLRQSCS